MVLAPVISPETAAWIRPRIDLSDLQPEAAARAESYLCGKCMLSLAELEDLCRITHMPLGYFFVSSAPEENDLMLQGWDGYPPRSVVATLFQMRERQNFVSDLRSGAGLDGAWAKHHDISCPPDAQKSSIESLVAWFEEHSIMVMQNAWVRDDRDWKLEPDDLSMLVLYDDFAPLIFLNSNAQGKENLLLQAYVTLTWRGSDLISKHRPSSASQKAERAAASLASGIPDGEPPAEEVISPAFWEWLRYGASINAIQPTHAARLANTSWHEVLHGDGA